MWTSGSPCSSSSTAVWSVSRPKFWAIGSVLFLIAHELNGSFGSFEGTKAVPFNVKNYSIWLVVWNICLIFFRGVAQPPAIDVMNCHLCELKGSCALAKLKHQDHQMQNLQDRCIFFTKRLEWTIGRTGPWTHNIPRVKWIWVTLFLNVSKTPESFSETGVRGAQTF